jgi:mono/diheme cytochrome c family protein
MSNVRNLLRRAGPPAAVVVGLTVSWSAAFGLPWDLDMVDSQAVKAYEQPMRPLPDAVAAQGNMVSPKHFIRNYANTKDPAAASLKSPFEATEQSVAKGMVMYKTYCSPCHGDDGVHLGMLAQPKRVPGVPPLAGPESRITTTNLNDGNIYLTIRNGSLSKIMPPYGYMMKEEEMWSIVQFLRDDKVGFANKYVEPAATPAEAPAGGN